MEVPSAETFIVERPVWFPGVIVVVYVPFPKSVTDETVPRLEVTRTDLPAPSERDALSRGIIVKLTGLPFVRTAVSPSNTVD